MHDQNVQMQNLQSVFKKKFLGVSYTVGCWTNEAIRIKYKFLRPVFLSTFPAHLLLLLLLHKCKWSSCWLSENSSHLPVTRLKLLGPIYKSFASRGDLWARFSELADSHVLPYLLVCVSPAFSSAPPNPPAIKVSVRRNPVLSYYLRLQSLLRFVARVLNKNVWDQCHCLT